MFFIRAATPEDIAELVAIERQGAIAPWSAQQLASACAGVGGESVGVLLIDEKAVGFVVYHVLAPEGEIRNIAVSLSYRGQGLGRTLLRWGLQKMAEQGVQRCFLEVRASNDVAIGLYHSEGFERVGRF